MDSVAFLVASSRPPFEPVERWAWIAGCAADRRQLDLAWVNKPVRRVGRQKLGQAAVRAHGDRGAVGERERGALDRVLVDPQDFGSGICSYIRQAD